MVLDNSIQLLKTTFCSYTAVIAPQERKKKQTGKDRITTTKKKQTKLFEHFVCYCAPPETDY